ncbi:MAG: hypothetical protein IJ515_05875 [Clostridia bacterium]|nr:hypothetical protein [Clostridia bacterium]
MKKTAKLYGIFLPIFLLLTAACTVLRSIACLNYLDEDGYYFSSSTLINISAIIAAAAIIFFLSYIWCAREEINLIPSFSSPANYIPCALVTVGLAFLSVQLFAVAFSNQMLVTFTQKFALVAAILALLAIGYFVVSALYISRRSIKRSNYGLITLLFLCAYVAFIYFDTSLPLNAPNKIADEMAYLFIALFFLYEIRLSLGRERWKQYIAFGFMAALLSAYSSIPALIVYFAKGKTISLSIYENVLTLMFFVFITLKLLLASYLTEDKTSSVVEGIMKLSAERSAELETPTETVEDAITANEEVAEEPDENQISIMDIEDEQEEEEAVTFFTEDAPDDSSETEEKEDIGE